MKITTIDIGTNSVRSLYADYDNQTFSNRKKNLKTTRIGEGVDKTRMLREENMIKTIDAIKFFIEESKTFGSKEIYIMATSAVRDSKNKDVFSQMLKKECDLPLDILSGVEEARAGLLGVLAGTKPTGYYLIIDIGGGSTELIVGKGNEILFEESLNMGCVRMTDRFLQNPLTSQEEIETLKVFVDQMALDSIEQINQYPIETVIGIGGTASTYGSMDLKMNEYDGDKIQNYNLSLKNIETLNIKLSNMSVEERKNVDGLPVKRSDIILAGGVILQTLLKQIHADKILLSDYDNLEGLMIMKKEGIK